VAFSYDQLLNQHIANPTAIASEVSAHSFSLADICPASILKLYNDRDLLVTDEMPGIPT
jgi:hypothetical protein